MSARRRPCRSIGASLVVAATAALAVWPPGAAADDALRVLTVERPPFSVARGTGYIGYSIELWDRVAEELGLSYELSAAESFSEMLAAVEDGAADLAVANISITAEREQTMDFSHPIFNSGLQVMVPAGSGVSESIFATILSGGLLKILGVAVLTLFVVAQCMWLFERGEGRLFARQYHRGIWQALWWTAVTVLGQNDRMPRNVAGRIVTLSWMLFGLFVLSAFVAEITSTLTVRNLQSNINGPSDLPGRRVATVEGSTADRYLTYNNIGVLRVESPEEMFRGVLEGEADAAVFDAPILAYHAANEGRGRLRLVGPVFQPEQFGIALASGSPYREEVNRALLSLWEDGTVQDIYEEWFGGIQARR